MSIQSNQTIIERLFQAGAHFGFKKSRRHPTVTKFLFTSKDGNDIFDLEKSALLLDEAKEFLRQTGLQGKNVMFVGTKTEVARIVKETAEKIEMPYATNRWIGGMLTNFSEIKKRINRLETLIAEKESGELERKYTKKERVMLNREVDKLQFNFGGIRGLNKPADVMVVVDPRYNEIAVNEANEIGIPIIAIMSSDCDASQISHPIVVNDALQSSVSLVLQELAGAYKDGVAAYVPKAPTTPNRTPRPSASRR